MNCTALLFLNDIDAYVCGVFKTFMKNSEDPFYLIQMKQSMKFGVKMDIRSVFFNYYPKIFAAMGVTYLCGEMLI